MQREELWMQPFVVNMVSALRTEAVHSVCSQRIEQMSTARGFDPTRHGSCSSAMR